METIVSRRTLSVHNEHEFLLRLENAGLTDEFAQRVIDSKDNELAHKVIRLIQNGGFEPSRSQKHAREIMGMNFFGIEEAIQYFGVNPSRQQRAAMSDIPFSEDVLEFYKDTHVLVAVFPFSILEIRAKASGLFWDTSWYNGESFAKDRGEIGWHLVLKTSAPGSMSKTWNEQQGRLAKDHDVPDARVTVYTIIGHFKATGDSLFGHIWVRTSSRGSSGGSHVIVGLFDGSGLHVDDDFDNRHNDYLGVSAARKIDS